MPDNRQIYYTYRDCLKMYASMLRDLSEQPEYINALIYNRIHSNFDHAIRQMIDDTLRQR